MFAAAQNANMLYATQHGTDWRAPFLVTYSGFFML